MRGFAAIAVHALGVVFAACGGDGTATSAPPNRLNLDVGIAAPQPDASAPIEDAPGGLDFAAVPTDAFGASGAAAAETDVTATAGDIGAPKDGPVPAEVTATADVQADSKAGAVAPAPASQGGPVAVQIGGTSDDGSQLVPWTIAGQAVPLIFGPQGGYHLWVSVCVPATAPVPLPVSVILTDTATGKQVPPGVLQLKTKLVALPGYPGQLCRLALPAFVDCACQMADRGVRVRVEIKTGNADQPIVSWAEHAIVPVHTKGRCLPPLQACAPFL